MTRRKFTTKFKTKLVLETLKERYTTQELSQKYEITPQQINMWKREFLANYVLENDIKLSMDGKRRAIDNIFIERLWRSVKYESIYINPPNSGIDLYHKLKRYFYFYNNERRHQGIDNQIPVNRYLIKTKNVA